MKRQGLIFTGFISALILAAAMGCGKKEKLNLPETRKVPVVTEAIATLHGIGDNDISGTITFTKVTGGIQIVANVTGLEPGEHGLHIFENGSCGASDSITLGAHFNPEKMPHGAPNDSLRHEGDLGNLEAVENTITHVEWTDARLSFTGKYSIIGRSVVIDENPDDFKTQPYGNSGNHIACGVIGIKKEEVPADTTGTLP